VTEHGYADPAALRQAINERLRALVREDSRLQLADLQRQFAYDRFLTRVFLAVDRDRWVLKAQRPSSPDCTGEHATRSMSISIVRSRARRKPRLRCETLRLATLAISFGSRSARDDRSPRRARRAASLSSHTSARPSLPASTWTSSPDRDDRRAG